MQFFGNDHGSYCTLNVIVPRTRFARFLLWVFPGLVARVDAWFDEHGDQHD